MVNKKAVLIACYNLSSISRTHLVNQRTNDKCVTLRFGFMADYFEVVFRVHVWSLVYDFLDLLLISNSRCIISQILCNNHYEFNYYNTNGPLIWRNFFANLKIVLPECLQLQKHSGGSLPQQKIGKQRQQKLVDPTRFQLFDDRLNPCCRVLQYLLQGSPIPLAHTCLPWLWHWKM